LQPRQAVGEPVVAVDALGVRPEHRGIGDVDDGNRPLVVVRVAFAILHAGDRRGQRAVTLYVGDVQFLAVGRDEDGPGIPAGGDEAVEPAGAGPFAVRLALR